MDQLRLGDVGTELVVELTNPAGEVVDLAGFTVGFHFKKPNKTTAVVSGSLYTDGTDGKVSYVTQAGDIDRVGVWRYQVRVTKAGTALTSDEGLFEVTPVLVEV